jgi:hypothetical protein
MGRIDIYEVPESGLTITACLELHSVRRTEPVSRRTHHLFTLAPAQSAAELFTAEVDRGERVCKECAN